MALPRTVDGQQAATAALGAAAPVPPPGGTIAALRRQSAVIRRRVMTIGEVDDEVEAMHERLAFAEGGGVMSVHGLVKEDGSQRNTTRFEDVDVLQQDPKREILVGHGNAQKLGGYDEATITKELAARMEKKGKYQLLLYACNVGKENNGGDSLAHRVIGNLRNQRYSVTALAPKGLAFVLDKDTHAVGNPYSPAQENGFAAQALGMYRAALDEVLTDIIAALATTEQAPELPSPAPSDGSASSPPEDGIAWWPGSKERSQANSEAALLRPADKVIEQDFNLLKSRSVTVPGAKFGPKPPKDSWPAYLTRLLTGYRDKATLKTRDNVLTKLELFMTMQCYQPVLRSGGLSYPELERILKLRYRRKFLDPAAVAAPAPATVISKGMPDAETEDWTSV